MNHGSGEVVDLSEEQNRERYTAMSEQTNPAESFLGTEQILTKLEEIKEGASPD